MANQNTAGWTDDRVQMLCSLWADGLSASCIASELGGVTRSAVIGKVHRLNLSYRKTIKIREAGAERGVFGTRTQRPPRKNYSVRQGRAAAPDRIERREAEAEIRAEFYAAEVADLSEDQKARAVTFAQLNNSTHCKWPYGDPRKPDFLFCGCDRMPSSPYCGPHTRIAAPRNSA